jgi:hypothetical protein
LSAQQVDDAPAVAHVAAELVRQPEIEQVRRHLVLQPVRPRLVDAGANRVRLYQREQRLRLLVQARPRRSRNPAGRDPRAQRREIGCREQQPRMDGVGRARNIYRDGTRRRGAEHGGRHGSDRHGGDGGAECSAHQGSDRGKTWRAASTRGDRTR